MKNLTLAAAMLLGSLTLICAQEEGGARFYNKEAPQDMPRSTSHLLFDFSKKLIINLGLQMKAEQEGTEGLSSEETMGQIQLLSTTVNELVRCTALAPEKEASVCFTYLTKLKTIGEPSLGEGFMRMLIDPPQSNQPESAAGTFVNVENVTKTIHPTKTQDPLMSELKL